MILAMSKLYSSSPLMLGIIEELDVFKIHKTEFCHRSSSEKVDELATSILQKGLIHPIMVRPAGDKFEIVAGNRRFKACSKLGWRKVLCHVVELNDKEAFEVSILENIQRKNLCPMDEAKTFQSYASEFGWGGISDLSKKIGKSVHYVERRIRLLDLPPDILQAVNSREITPSTAEELLCISDKQKQSFLAKMAREKQLSTRKLRKLVKEIRHNPIYGYEDTELFYNVFNDLDVKTQRAFDKSITVVKLAMHRLTDIMGTIEGNWIVHEALRDHRNVLHERIDLLIKEKKKI
jgi:ParB family transcriptional regulator, chromosome partitioning protein